MKTIKFVIGLAIILFQVISGHILKAQSDCNSPLLAGNTSTLQYSTINTTLSGVNTDSLLVDLNSDGTPDLLFGAYYQSSGIAIYSETRIFILNSNIEIITDTILPSRLIYGDSISICKYWKYSSQKMALATISIEPGYFTFGNWLSEGTGYLGFRLIQTNDTLYGWFYLQSIVTETGSQLTIYGYAIQSISNILLEKTSKSKIRIFPVPSEGCLTIELPESVKDFNFHITNSEGKILLQEYHSNQNSIYLNNIPLGLYFIEIQSENYYDKKKFIIE